MRVRLVEQIADGRAERSREDERSPEKSGSRDLREEVEGSDDRERRGEDERAALEAEAGRVGRPVAERGSERLREQDRRPVNASIFGVATDSTATEPAVKYQVASDAISSAKRIAEPPR